MSSLVTETRQHYAGFPFIFASDGGHHTDFVVSSPPHRRTGSWVRYLKPLVPHVVLDGVPPQPNPLLFVSFHWVDDEGNAHSITRVRLCNAWQKLYNHLIYYASFLDDPTEAMSEDDRVYIKDQFTLWNSVFCEVDVAISLLHRFQTTNEIPAFNHYPLASVDLSVSSNRTDPDTQPHSMTTIFLQWAERVTVPGEQQRPERMRALEARLTPWVPCEGYPTMEATGWKSDGSQDGLGEFPLAMESTSTSSSASSSGSESGTEPGEGGEA